MRWVCEDCGYSVAFPHRPDPVTVYGEDTPRELDEKTCGQCDETKQGLLLPTCDLCRELEGVRFANPSEWARYCENCSAHLVYTRDMAADREKYADAFCPACFERKDRNDMDYHHWDYDTDTGIQLCRECHETVHGGMTVMELKEYKPHTHWQFAVIWNLLKLVRGTWDQNPRQDEFYTNFNIPERFKGRYDGMFRDGGGPP